jgi:hypothetical protein
MASPDDFQKDIVKYVLCRRWVANLALDERKEFRSILAVEFFGVLHGRLGSAWV